MKFRLSAVPKKSRAAAVCQLVMLLWGVWMLGLTMLTSYMLYFRSGLPAREIQPPHRLALNLTFALLAIVLSLWYIIPNNRHYKTGLKVILGLFVARALITDVVSIVRIVSAPGQADIGAMALSLLAVVLGANAILLYGALRKRSTEKLAALAVLVWFVVHNVESTWRDVSQGWSAAAENDFTRMFIVNTAINIMVPLLIALLTAAALYLHPVLERPMLQPRQEEQIQE